MITSIESSNTPEIFTPSHNFNHYNHFITILLDTAIYMIFHKMNLNEYWAD